MTLDLNQLVAAVTRIFDLMEKNPELMALADVQPDTRPLIMTLFMKVAQYDAPKLNTEQMEHAFNNALRSYSWSVEENDRKIAEEEKRAKEEAIWDGPLKGPVH